MHQVQGQVRTEMYIERIGGVDFVYEFVVGVEYSLSVENLLSTTRISCYEADRISGQIVVARFGVFFVIDRWGI